jgi:DNA-binding NarL/FixJ family response regulator
LPDPRNFGIRYAMPIKVAIVEDDAGVRENLVALIGSKKEFHFHGAYANAEAALKQIPQDWPDVVLMDINLPTMSGIELVAKLKEQRPGLLVLMLTVYSDHEQIFNSLKKGASGYLLKKTPPAKILEAIRDVQAGGSPMSNAIARQVVQYFQKSPPSSQTENLTKREHEILACLTQGQQYKEIADVLTISLETVRAHVRHIYEKLHVRSRTEAVVIYLGKEDMVLSPIRPETGKRH